MPLAEFQPFIVGFCIHCGADAYYCGDWESIRWENSADGCLCCLDLDEAPAFLKEAESHAKT